MDGWGTCGVARNTHSEYTCRDSVVAVLFPDNLELIVRALGVSNMDW